jgi:hypothetical protein
MVPPYCTQPPPSLSLLVLILFLSLILPSTQLEVETKIDLDGPKVCVWSENVLPKNVAAMCNHRGLLYVAGQFNRFGDEEVRSFVILDAKDGKVVWAKSKVRIDEKRKGGARATWYDILLEVHIMQRGVLLMT